MPTELQLERVPGQRVRIGRTLNIEFIDWQLADIHLKFLHTDKNNSYKYKSTKSNTPTLLHATSQQTKKRNCYYNINGITIKI